MLSFLFILIIFLVGITSLSIICKVIPVKQTKRILDEYKDVKSSLSLTGNEMVKTIFEVYNLPEDVYGVKPIPDNDPRENFFNPNDKQIYLQDTIFNSSTLEAQCLAAHECFHAIADFNKSKIQDFYKFGNLFTLLKIFSFAFFFVVVIVLQNFSPGFVAMSMLFYALSGIFPIIQIFSHKIFNIKIFISFKSIFN